MKNYEKRQRDIIRALFCSLTLIDENIRWQRYRIDRTKLERYLKPLGEVPSDVLNSFVERFGISVLRQDALKLSVKGFERKIDRQTFAEGLGAAGVQFLPTRQSATRAAFESAREIAYFGFGDMQNQSFACPIAQLCSYLCPEQSQLAGDDIILRDMREPFASSHSIYDILTRDVDFHENVTDAASLQAFQTQLRAHVMNREFIEMGAEFFNRLATFGVRDALRWMLGSRHPWFDWNHACELIERAFQSHGTDHFNTPQIVYYTYDPQVAEVDIDAIQTQNQTVIRAFADQLRGALHAKSSSVAAKLSDQFERLSAWILDIHHDYPDFDLESQGYFGPGKSIDFLGHSIQNQMNRDLLGKDTQLRLNQNMRAHFEALDLTHHELGDLSNDEREIFFATVTERLQAYDEAGGIMCQTETQAYRRIPCLLFLIQDLGCPKPHANERLLDTFDLSQMTQLEHASYMRMFPEISEKLVVFFALTLRHLVDTEHVPDLRPRNFIKDFLVLGLWGTRTPNLRINLYIDKAFNENDLPSDYPVRCEIKFVGTEQVETHPLEHIRDDAKLTRMLVSNVAPLIPPSILRNLGTFTMAMEEFTHPIHEPDLNPFNLIPYLADVIHETTIFGVRRSLNDIAAVLEYLVQCTKKNDGTAKTRKQQKK